METKLTNSDISQTDKKEYIKPTTGIYPVTSTGISLFYNGSIDHLIFRKDGKAYNTYKKSPSITIRSDENDNQKDITGKYSNGLVEAFQKKLLPAVIFCAPCYDKIEDLITEITELASQMKEKELLKNYARLSLFYFPTFILISNGIMYDEVTYNLKKSLEGKGFQDKIIENICNKVIRGSIPKEGYRIENTYIPFKTSTLKIAVPRYDLFIQVLELLNSKNFKFSIQKNPHRVEFEKAMINIATNTAAMLFCLDKNSLRLKKIRVEDVIEPKLKGQRDLIEELQKAIFQIGQKSGAFSESESFERIWYPRKEQILKQDSKEVCNSTLCFNHMIKTNTFPEKITSFDNSLIRPLKGFSEYYKLNDQFILFEELEKSLICTLRFAQKNAKEIFSTF